MAKFGEGSLGAFWRQGLKELRAIIYPESNVAQETEHGMWGTLTQGEVAEARRGTVHGQERPHEDKSVLGERLREAEQRQDRDEPGRERDV